MTETLSTEEILERWSPGSGEWDWPTEWANITPHKNGTLVARLIRSIAAKGVKKPLQLGDDGRVWDGHHRLLLARLLGIKDMPVTTAMAVTWKP